jgi:ubiquinone/menaquinone biosynthesis C-methylase UbiE
MNQSQISVKLKLLSKEDYVSGGKFDPIRFYFWPIIGRMYRKRVELCLAECNGGERVLDIGFGSGVNFLNLNELYKEIHGLDLTAKVGLVVENFKKYGLQPKLLNGNILNMPYPDNYFDSVLLVSILEHIKPDEQLTAFREIKRVLKSGGQLIYGVPVEQPFMVFSFRLLGVNIREHHFSTEEDVSNAAQNVMEKVRLVDMNNPLPLMKPVYQVGHFVKL